MASKPTRPRRKRRWWQHLLRVLALIVLLAGGAYVLLPYWLPAGLMREHLERTLSRQAGVEVTIGSLGFSWAQTTLSDLRVVDPDDPNAPLLRVGRLATPFRPLRTLMGYRPPWAELDELTLRARFEREGPSSLDVLERLDLGESPDRVSVGRGEVHVELPDAERPDLHHRLTLRISDVQLLSGRVAELGRVTVSASLVQNGLSAPVSLRLTDGGGQVNTSAAASFRFAGVRLEQIPIVALLGLPLERLAGRLSGSLELRMNPEGIVDRFAARLGARGLAVEPSDGPPLGPVEAASVDLDATWDPISDRLEVRRTRVELPGTLRLSGKAVFMGNMLEGLGSLRSADVQGAVNPASLAALIRGAPGLTDELVVAGPVRFALTGRRLAGGKTLRIGRLRLDANDASIRLAGQVRKPPGTRLSLRASASRDDRREAWTVREASLAIGGNRIEIDGRWARLEGALEELRDAWAPRAGEDQAHSPAEALRRVGPVLLRRLGDLDLRAEATVSDLPALTRLTGRTLDANALRLKGALRGGLSFQGSAGRQWRVHGLLDGPSSLTVGGLTWKRPGRAVEAELAGRLTWPSGRQAGERIDLAGLSARVASGTSRLDVTDAEATIWPAEGGGSYLLDGRLAVLRAEGLLAIPEAGWLGLVGAGGANVPIRLAGDANATVRLAGDLGGKLSLLEARLRADALAAEAGELFTKSAGEATDLFVAVRSLPGGDLSARGSLRAPWIELTASGRLDARGRPRSAQAAVRVTEAERLAERSAKLADWLGSTDLAGAFDAWVRYRPEGRPEVRARVGATDLSVRWGGASARRKSAGTPATVDLTAGLGDRADRLSVRSLDVSAQLGGSRVVGSLVPDAPMTPAEWLDGQTLRGRELDANMSLTLAGDEALGEMVPETRRWMRRWGLGGRARVDVDLHADANEYVAGLDVEAGELVASGFSPGDLMARVAGAERAPWPGVSVVKSPGMPAGVRATLRAGRDLSWWRLVDGEAELGPLRVVARTGPVTAEQGPLAGAWRVTVMADELGRLGAMVPALHGAPPSGELFVDLSHAPGADPGAISMQVHTRGASAAYRGRLVRVAGGVDVDGLRRVDGGAWSVDRVRTRDLRVVAGVNEAWVLADVEGLPRAPSGTVEVLATRLDDLDLLRWLNPQGVREARAEMSASQRRAARRQAVASLHRLVPLLRSARLGVRFSVDRLKTYDPTVGESYLLRRLESRLSVREGLAELAYNAMLNGGAYRGTLSCDLGEAALRADGEMPRVSIQTDSVRLVASEELAPQIAKFFPGNHVEGHFTRSERSTAPLDRWVATLIDSRYPLGQTGSAKTVATEGYVLGRAAPEFVSRMFPGLNLARYRYETMTAFAEFNADGSAENDMIFNGIDYDLYMEGTTGPDNYARYTVGLILLGRDPEWNHAWRQGRLPLLKVRGLIKGGKMLDQEISFLWPNETLFDVFLKNSLVYRAWVNQGKPKSDESP